MIHLAKELVVDNVLLFLFLGGVNKRNIDCFDPQIANTKMQHKILESVAGFLCASRTRRRESEAIASSLETDAIVGDSTDSVSDAGNCVDAVPLVGTSTTVRSLS